MCENTYVNIQTSEVLDLNRLEDIKSNALLKHSPHLFEEWDFEKNNELGLDIYNVTKGSQKKAWWYCTKCKSKYDMEVVYRKKGSNCPFCSGRRVNNTNSLKTIKPLLAEEWDYVRNNKSPSDVTCNSREVVWWKCIDCKESYDMAVYNKSKGKGCRYCSGRTVSLSNCLATKDLKLAKEWHQKLNGELTPYDVTCGESRVVWWLCPDCESSYNMSLNDRTSKKCNCPYCNGRRVNITNSLKSMNTVIASQWHPTKNGDLTTESIHYHSSEVVWWLGECGHEWENAVRNRRFGNADCPECSKLSNKAPHIARLLLNKSESCEFTVGSNKKVDWQCDCGQIVKNKTINEICSKGYLPCANCSDGKSYPEKYMFTVLKLLKVDFEWEKVFEWSNNKRYDFYIEYLGSKILIECHGMQHYESSFEYLGSRTLIEEIENDAVKYKMAISNGIDKYIIIDCRKSSSTFIKNSILNSELVKIFDIKNLEWNKVSLLAEKSLVLYINEIWNNGNKSIKNISKEMNLCSATVTSYLKRGMENGWNDYSPNKSRKNGSKSRKKEIVKIDYDTIVIFESASKAYLDTNIDSSSIIAVCRGKRKTAGGFKWMYLEDYEKEYGKLS